MVNPTVWVTGAAGFIGRHLVRALAERGMRVVGFGRGSSGPQAGQIFVGGGLSTEVLDTAMSSHGAPSMVYHFAGGSTVGASICNPLADFDSSVATTARLLDVLRRHAVSAPVVLASSAAVYGGGHAGPIGLDATLAPFSPYGHHKRMAEHLGLAYAETYGMQVTILRLFSIYGPLIGKQVVFDLCTRLAARPALVQLGGSGKERRDWVHVNDVVDLCLHLSRPAPGQARIYNVGTGQAIAIADVAKIIGRAWCGSTEIIFTGKSRPGDPFSLVADPASLPPGFVPRVGVEQGLEEFVQWFRTARAHNG